jgi:hypothetical protein
MCQLIEQLANDKGINVDDANYIFTFISDYLVNKIPALSQVIEDVFENVEAYKLKEDINKAIELIQQQQWKEKFKNYMIPPLNYTILQIGDE